MKRAEKIVEKEKYFSFFLFKNVFDLLANVD